MTDETGGDASRLPAVVWDMGGILYRYFTEVLLDIAAERHWDLGEVPMGPTGDVADDEYAAMDRGDLEEPDYLEVVRRRLRTRGIEDDPVDLMDWPHELREEVWGAVRDVHDRGRPQAVLTNDAARWLGEDWWETWEPAAWFDVMVDVSTLGVRKPAATPYLVTTERLGLRPAQCLFVDDMTVNCTGAEDVGMASVWFDVTDPEGSVDRVLEAAGISP